MVMDNFVWHTTQLRLTAFTVDTTVDPTGWWEQLFGSTPTSSIRKAKESLVQDDGDYEGGRLVVATRPGRVDWLWGSTLTPAVVQEKGIPTLGLYGDARPKFLPLMEKWLDLAPGLNRLAFGTILDLPVADEAEAFAVLQKCLPGFRLGNTTRTSDFIYQINRVTDSMSSPGQKLNRVRKWSSLRAIASLESDGLKLMREFLTVRLEMDVNTANATQAQPIHGRQARDVLAELVDAANRIAREGDVE